MLLLLVKSSLLYKKSKILFSFLYLFLSVSSFSFFFSMRAEMMLNDNTNFFRFIFPMIFYFLFWDIISKTLINAKFVYKKQPASNQVCFIYNALEKFYEAGSEIETKFIISVLNNFKFDAVLSIHAPFKIVNYDGAAKKCLIIRHGNIKKTGGTPPSVLFLPNAKIKNTNVKVKNNSGFIYTILHRQDRTTDCNICNILSLPLRRSAP